MKQGAQAVDPVLQRLPDGEREVFFLGDLVGPEAHRAGEGLEGVAADIDHFLRAPEVARALAPRLLLEPGVPDILLERLRQIADAEVLDRVADVLGLRGDQVGEAYAQVVGSGPIDFRSIACFTAPVTEW